MKHDVLLVVPVKVRIVNVEAPSPVEAANTALSWLQEDDDVFRGSNLPIDYAATRRPADPMQVSFTERFEDAVPAHALVDTIGLGGGDLGVGGGAETWLVPTFDGEMSFMVDPKMHAPEGSCFDRVGDEQGWNDRTRLEVLKRYLEARDLVADAFAFARMTASAENESG